MKAVVCTHSRHDLARLAVRRLLQLAAGIDSVVVLDASESMSDCPGAEVVHKPYPKFCGAATARGLYPGEDLLCIDDDVMLISAIDVNERYTACRSKPPNGFMLMVFRPWREGVASLRQVRLRSPDQAPGYDWADVAAAHGSEFLDNAWLHIDKGSSGDDELRTALEEHLSGVSVPSFAQRLKNFAASAVKHVAAGMPMCTDEQVAERFAICQACEFYQDGTCQKCGCPLARERKFISKLSWAKESCPVGKWGPAGNSQ